MDAGAGVSEVAWHPFPIHFGPSESIRSVVRCAVFAAVCGYRKRITCSSVVIDTNMQNTDAKNAESKFHGRVDQMFGLTSRTSNMAQEKVTNLTRSESNAQRAIKKNTTAAASQHHVAQGAL